MLDIQTNVIALQELRRNQKLGKIVYQDLCSTACLNNMQETYSILNQRIKPHRLR